MDERKERGKAVKEKEKKARICMDTEGKQWEKNILTEGNRYRRELGRKKDRQTGRRKERMKKLS
jgi:hypothetical protein